MFSNKFKNKLFCIAFSNGYQQTKLRSWTAKFKEYISINVAYFQKTDRCKYYHMHQQFKFFWKKSKFIYSFNTHSTTKKLISIVFKRFPPSRPFYAFAAAAYSFSWEENSVSNSEIWSYVEELELLELQSRNEFELPKQADFKDLPSHWENILDEPNIKIWKLSYSTDIIQYKVFGRFSDITANQFFTVQTNLDYRKKWDNLVDDIQIVDENKSTGEKVLRWITRLPFPLSPREYVFLRKAQFLKENNVMLLFSKSVDHPSCIPNSKFVRVPHYISHMVIKPHTSADELGLDYLLTYCDSPKMAMPTRLTSWVVQTGIPDFIEKLHKASLQVDSFLTAESRSITSSNEPNLLQLTYRRPSYDAG